MPDAEYSATFLSALGTPPWTWQTFDDDDSRKDKALASHWTQDFAEALPRLQKANNAGAGIFITVNETDGNGRKASNVVKVRAVFVDLDGAPLQPVLDWHLKPHIIVESSPGRYHAYWRVMDVPLDKFTLIQTALAKMFNGDTTVKDLPRVMRVPGFVHRKAEPFMSRIVSIGDHPAYTIDDLENEMDIDEFTPTMPPPPQHRAQPRRVPDSYLSHALDGACAEIANAPQGARNDTLNKQAFAIGQRLHAFPHRSGEAVGRLMDAGTSCGLSESEARTAVNSGVLSGQAKPKEIDNRPVEKSAQVPPLITEQPSPDDPNPWPVSNLSSWYHEEPPEQEWILDGILPRGIVCQLSASGGTGKTFLLMSIGLGISTGRPAFKSFVPAGPMRVLAMLAEDPECEIRRRYHRITHSMGLDSVDIEMINEHFVLVAGHSAPLVELLDGNTVPTPHYSRLRSMIREHKPDVVFLDPQSRFCGIEENTNHLAARFISLLQDLATEGNCTIMITHHVNKHSGTTRGATAFRDGCRWGAEMRELTEEDSKKFGIDASECYRYIELAFTKTNYSEKPQPIYFERGQGGTLSEFNLRGSKLGDVAVAISDAIQALGARLTQDQICYRKEGAELREHVSKRVPNTTSATLKAALAYAVENTILRTISIGIGGAKTMHYDIPIISDDDTF